MQDFKLELRKGIKLTFYQVVENVDGEVVAVEEWRLDPYVKDKLKRIGFTEKDLRIIFAYAQANSLFENERSYYKGVEVVSKSCFVTQEFYENALKFEGERIEKELKLVEEKLSDEKKILKDLFVDEVYVTSDGYFAKNFTKNQPESEGVTSYEYVTSPYYDDPYVKEKASKVIVKSQQKEYEYFVPNDEVLSYLKEKHPCTVREYEDALKRKAKALKGKIESLKSRVEGLKRKLLGSKLEPKK